LKFLGHSVKGNSFFIDPFAFRFSISVLTLSKRHFYWKLLLDYIKEIIVRFIGCDMWKVKSKMKYFSTIYLTVIIKKDNLERQFFFFYWMMSGILKDTIINKNNISLHTFIALVTFNKFNDGTNISYRTQILWLMKVWKPQLGRNIELKDHFSNINKSQSRIKYLWELCTKSQWAEDVCPTSKPLNLPKMEWNVDLMMFKDLT